jgi:hypothetical protein
MDGRREERKDFEKESFEKREEGEAWEWFHPAESKSRTGAPTNKSGKATNKDRIKTGIW